MKILTLIIKQKFFDQIVDGTKKEETRELRPKTEKRYVDIGDEGAIVGIVDYDAIRLFVGYNKNRDTALVEINGAIIEELVDENDENIFFEENGVQHLMCNIVYQLGNVLEVNRQ